MDERTFEMLLQLPWPGLEVGESYQAGMRGWMRRWKVTAEEMEALNCEGLVKTWMVSGWQCGEEEARISGKRCVVIWSFVGGVDSEEFCQKAKGAEATTRKPVEVFIRERNQEREACVKEHQGRLAQMTAEQRACFDEKDWSEHRILELIPEMKFQGSVPPAVFGYSLTEAGLAALFETLEKWIVEQKVLRDGFLQVRKSVSDTWKIVSGEVSAAAEKMFRWCMALDYLEERVVGDTPNYRWSTEGAEFEDRMRKAIIAKEKQGDVSGVQADDMKTAKTWNHLSAEVRNDVVEEIRAFLIARPYATNQEIIDFINKMGRVKLGKNTLSTSKLGEIVEALRRTKGKSVFTHSGGDLGWTEDE